MFASRDQRFPIAPVPPVASYTSKSIGGSALTMTDPYLSTGTSHAVYLGSGKMFTASYYDEGYRYTGVVDLDNGVCIDGGYNDPFGGANASFACCKNSTYIYFTKSVRSIGPSHDTWPALYPSYTTVAVTGAGTYYDWNAWEGVYRKNISDYTRAPFIGGKLVGGAVDFSTGPYKMLYEYQQGDAVDLGGGLYRQDIIDQKTRAFRGIACTETEVYVSDPYNSTIHVLDASTMAVLRTLTVNNTMAHLAVAADGNLWVLDGLTIKKVNKTTGSVMLTITPGDGNAPRKIGVLDDGRLWHDSSIDFKIRIRSTNGVTVQETWGNSILEQGGAISTSQPNLGPNVGFHKDGTSYYVVYEFVAGTYGTFAAKYNSSGVEQTRVYSTQFIECGDIDVDAGKFYSRQHRFAFNPDGDPQSTLEAFTLDPTNAAADPRSIGNYYTVSTFVRNVSGRKYIYEFDQFGGNMAIREIVPGVNRQRPAGLMMRNAGVNKSGIWRPPDDGTLAMVTGDISYEDVVTGNIDRDFIFQYVDHSGTCWRMVATDNQSAANYGLTTRLQKFPCGGLDVNNNPIYSWSTMVEENISTILGTGSKVLRFFYDSDTDTAVISGHNNAYPIGLSTYWNYGCGHVWKCYLNWTGRRGARSERWTMYPTIATNDIIRSADLHRNLLVLGHMSAAKCTAYRIHNGASLGDVISSGLTGVDTYWNDTAHSVRVRALDSAGIRYCVLKERGISGAALIHTMTVT